MFRLLRVIIKPSKEPTQDSLIPSALWDPVALTIGVVIILYCKRYGRGRQPFSSVVPK